ncbi:MAG: TetR/AcrR family transcriptional regulator [Pseudomonadota bacterium]
MARTRRELDAGQKRDALMAAARRLFMAEGYDATGMARIAAEAGVAPNTLYWYFDDKDALLIALLDELVAEALAEYAQVQARPLDAQLLWLLGKFDAAPGLVTTVHARLAQSPAIHAWHERFHRMVEALVISLLATHGVPEAERYPAARIAMFVVEGLLSHHAGAPGERATLAALLAARIVPAR